MSRRLILLRHGQTEFNATGRMQGQLDTELSDMGRAQARATAAQLQQWDIRAVYSSDLSRAEETATILAEELGLTAKTDSRLRETDLGQWQGKSHTEVDQQFPGQRQYWRFNADWSPPQGESRLQVARRCREFIDELMDTLTNWENGSIVCVGHGGAICALTAHLLNFEPPHYSLLSGLGNTSWAQLTARPRCDWGDLVGAQEAAPMDFTPGGDMTAVWQLDAWNASALGIPWAPAGAGQLQSGEGGGADTGEGTSVGITYSQSYSDRPGGR